MVYSLEIWMKNANKFLIEVIINYTLVSEWVKLLMNLLGFDWQVVHDINLGEVVYHLALPASFDRVHDVFCVSQLRRYIRDDSHILRPNWMIPCSTRRPPFRS